jgi:chemotaxis protein CheD
VSALAMPFDVVRSLRQVEQRVQLRPGHIFASRQPAVVTAIVSSSVVVCLWGRGASGATHFLLPRGGRQRSARYGNHALPMLLERVRDLDTTPSSIFASVFGGAGVDLGRWNLEEAMEFLSRQQIPVIRSDAGLDHARKLTLRTHDGSSVVRKIQN